MLTQIVGSKRICLSVYLNQLKSWDYIKDLLTECGFDVIQEGSPKEYVMKGCRDKVLVYVKYLDYNHSVIVFMDDKDQSDQINIEWGDTKKYHLHGEDILTKIRDIWFL